MGGYKKFKKQEKAKVKLRGKKLAEATNITDTNFKVKKVVVKEQLKEHGEYELLSNKHLNLKELITRLSHHNAGVRKEGLAGVEQLLNRHGQDFVLDNLSELLKSIIPLTLSIEAEIRKKSSDLILKVFQHVSTSEMGPLFEIVVRYFTCAITHIDPGIRSDSLRLLDIMLKEFPDLTVSRANILLPNFVNLISQRDGSGHARTLSLNLDGKVTSEKWRAKVVGRLNMFFSALIDHLKKDPRPARTEYWSDENHTYLRLFNPITTPLAAIDAQHFPLKKFAETLMPLLLSMAAEAVPSSNNESTGSNRGLQPLCTVEIEVAALVQSVVEVILHLRNLLEQHPAQTGEEIKCFEDRWSNEVSSKLLDKRFPYAIRAVPLSKKRKQEADQVLVALKTNKSANISSLHLNMKLCLLAFYFTRSDNLLINCCKYIPSTQRGGKESKAEMGDLVCECLEAASSRVNKTVVRHMEPLLNLLVDNSLDGKDRKATTFLTKVSIGSVPLMLQINKGMDRWLRMLPSLLTTPKLPLSIIRSMAQLAKCNLSIFEDSFIEYSEQIIGNLPILKIIHDYENEGKQLITYMFHWINNKSQKTNCNTQLDEKPYRNINYNTRLCYKEWVVENITENEENTVTLTS